MHSVHSHAISPAKVLRGNNAWLKGKKLIPLLCKKPLIIGRSKVTALLRHKLMMDLNNQGIYPVLTELQYDCCEIDLKRLKEQAINNGCDGIIASGGGKVLDSGKLIASRLNLPCITIPLSASTCAGWTALANIYSTNGAFIKDQVLANCPNLLIFDYTLVRSAPSRTLRSGIADAIAKWYEASLSSSVSDDALVQQSVQMSRVLRDQLLMDGDKAFNSSDDNAWARVADSCALTAGLIGGIGGAKCRTAIAHPLHDGLTQIQSSKNSLHGEIVGFGILVQLKLEEFINGSQLASQARLQLLPFLRRLNLPVSLQELGLSKISISELRTACDFACRDGSEIHHLPFKVNANLLLEVISSDMNERCNSSTKVLGKVK